MTGKLILVCELGVIKLGHLKEAGLYEAALTCVVFKVCIGTRAKIYK